MDVWEILDGVGSVAGAISDLAGAIGDVKDVMRGGGLPAAAPPPGPWAAMGPFSPQGALPFPGVDPWLPQLQQAAAANGNPWVPAQPAGFMGVDLTGLWCDPADPSDQVQIRQSGPYLALVAGPGGVPEFFGEGLVDPRTAGVAFIGRYVNGAVLQVQGRVLPGWWFRGAGTVAAAWGAPMNVDLEMRRVA